MANVPGSFSPQVEQELREHLPPWSLWVVVDRNGRTMMLRADDDDVSPAREWPAWNPLDYMSVRELGILDGLLKSAHARQESARVRRANLDAVFRARDETPT